MQRLIFDYSPAYFILCFLLGLGYAYVLYSSRYTWSKSMNRALFVLRAILVTGLIFLLLGPILKQTENITEQPSLVFLIDNSKSVKETTDTTRLLAGLNQITDDLRKQRHSVEWSTFSGVSDSVRFNATSSDLSSALRETVSRYEGKNLAGIVLVSDGIYNNGLSPLYLPMRIPVHTVGVGDTTERADVILKNVAYNRIVYQGNKFPLQAEVSVNGLVDQEIVVSVLQQGKVVQQQRKNSGTRMIHVFNFQLEANTQGMQRIEVRVEAVPRETNLKNNRSNAFVEVVEGKKKILLVARAPHPDIKALRSVIEKNSNYEFILHMPGIQDADAGLLVPGKVDLLIAYQSPDMDGITTPLLSSFLKAKSSALIVIGQKTQLRLLPAIGVPATFDPVTQRDEVQAVLNPAYHDLGFSDGLNSNITHYPPVSVPFGKFSFPATSKMILQQRIGNVITNRPLLYTVENEAQKIAVLVGEGIWKWRLSEFQETEKTVSFDELFSKLLQYLSTHDDRRRFRCFPIQQEFTSDGPVVMESQVYNDLFEPVYGNTIDLELQNELGTINRYRYTTGQGNSRYRIAGLSEGVYRYKASTELKGKKEEMRGEFLLTGQNQELQNLTADAGLMRALAESTGGKYHPLAEMSRLSSELSTEEVQSIIHSEDSFHPLINLKWVFFGLLALISMEWFLRKYSGAY